MSHLKIQIFEILRQNWLQTSPQDSNVDFWRQNLNTYLH